MTTNETKVQGLQVLASLIGPLARMTNGEIDLNQSSQEWADIVTDTDPQVLTQAYKATQNLGNFLRVTAELSKLRELVERVDIGRGEE